VVARSRAITTLSANTISWVDWNLDDERRQLLEFTKKLAALRHEHRYCAARDFSKAGRGAEVSDVMWVRHDGAAMSEEDWTNSETRSFGVFYSGEGLDDWTRRGPL
jgi:isoamylase